VSTFIATLTIEWSGADRLTRGLHRYGLRFLFNKIGAIVAALVVIGGVLAFADTSSHHHELHLTPQSAGIGLLVLLILNTVLIFIHELGHAVLLVHYGRRVKASGFRIYFGAPTFFIDSSDALMLGRGRRIAQSFAGPYFEAIATATAAIALWAWPDAGLAPTLYRFVLLNIFVLFLNLVPLLELDGYWILSDALRLPDLRPRSLSFMRRDLWSKLWRRERFTRAEIGLGLYGTIGVAFTIFCLVSAFYFWRQTFGDLTSKMWDAGVLGIAALFILVAFVAGPLLRALVESLRAVAANVAAVWRRARFRSQRRWRVEAAELLDAQPAFDDLSVDVLSDLAGRVMLTRFGAGSSVVRQGERPDAYYVVRAGELDVIEEDGDAERVIRRLLRGDAFGELGLATGAPRRATVRAVTASQVFVIDKGTFDRLLADHIELPEFAPTLQTLAELRALGPFAQLPADQLARVRDEGTWLTVPPGADVVTKGEAGDAFYAVESGRLDVIGNGQGRSTLGPGDHFGEIALLADVPRTATVRAATPARVFRLSREGFDRLVADAFRRGRLTSAAPVEFMRE
jgi:CRP-like cAMP-binding protein